MAETIVNTPTTSNDSGVAGWAIALIIVVIAALLAGIYLYRHQGAVGGSGANINVTVPTTGSGGTGSTGGTGGGSGTGY